MTEWYLNNDHVSTFEFHKDRERAPHLEQEAHRHRLLAARDLIMGLMPSEIDFWYVSDLGCGDGGLLQLLEAEGVTCWGYDFCPANTQGWVDRGLTEVHLLDWTEHYVDLGHIVVLTEVLEHLLSPHHELEWLFRQLGVKYIVASSPIHEDSEHHASEHNWAWDYEGYEKLFTDAGWKIRSHTTSEWSQLIVAER